MGTIGGDRSKSSNREKGVMVCNRALKWWHEQVNEATPARREAHARCTPNKTAAGLEEYATALSYSGVSRKKVKEMVEKKGIRKDVLNKNKRRLRWRHEPDVGRDKRDTRQTSRRGRHGNSYITSTKR